MREIALLILLVAAASGRAGAQAMSSGDKQVFDKLGWLVARWEMVDPKPGRSGFEQWTKVSPVELRGVGVRLAGEDTLFVERLRILVRDKVICYVADVPENQAPVYFRLTEISQEGFVFENQGHDFPKKIAYQLKDGRLKATISGDGKSIDYFFAHE